MLRYIAFFFLLYFGYRYFRYISKLFQQTHTTGTGNNTSSTHTYSGTTFHQQNQRQGHHTFVDEGEYIEYEEIEEK